MGSQLDVFHQFKRDHPEEAERIRRLVEEGRKHLENGSPDEARQRFVRVLAIFPYVPAALTNLAAIALAQRNFDQAEEYLAQAMRHFPRDPSVQAVAARLWLQRGSLPNVYHHARRAVENLAWLRNQPELLRDDPSLFDRARVIVISTLTLFAADALMLEVKRLLPDVPWTEDEWTYFGIAHFNLGEFDQAENAWRAAGGGDDSAAAVYSFLMQLVREGLIYPFSLDYNLNARLPGVEELRQAIEEHVSASLLFGERRPLRVVRSNGGEEREEDGEHEDMTLKESRQLIQAVRLALPRHVPTLAVAWGLRHIFRGEDEEAELALSILFFERWPYMPQLLRTVQGEETFSYRVRLNAALYLLWLGGADDVRRFLSGLDPDLLSVDDRFIWHSIWIQLALLEEDAALARTHELQAQPLLEQLSEEMDAWVHVFNELTLRIDPLERRSAPGAEASPHAKATAEPPTQSGMDKIVPFLPRHLRQAQKKHPD